ncbi:MAG: hypothetical protein LAT82_04720 [Nanoarchaeota archaeon]|nr:hypothetical protein [Nanoarchaeota archaeon]
MTLNQTLESGIRNLVKAELEGIEIGKLRGLMYPSTEFQTIQNLERIGIIRKIDIDQGLVGTVLNRARLDYDLMQRVNHGGTINRFADHVDFPECFAYGLKEGHFTDKEILQIPFDHDLDVDSYVKRYKDVNLFPNLTNLVLNYQRYKQRREEQNSPHFF